MDKLELSELITEKGYIIKTLVNEIGKVIVGQQYLVDRLLIGLLADGHLLIEGVPGLAKTTAVRSLAESLDSQFSRIQFTPDLLPADLVGTQIYRDGEFEVKKGPIFGNLILADEINRAPAKVQSALLEAMEERTVTIGGTTFKLPVPFLVMATQNPVEQEGTYPLPEAQMDRFMMKLMVGYPSKSEEKEVVNRVLHQHQKEHIKPILTPDGILELRDILSRIYVDDKIKDYALDIVTATRNPDQYGLNDVSGYLQMGGSPRASICLLLVGRALAFLKGRGYLVPDDIKQIAPDVLRHRIIISYEAEAEGLSADDIIQMILQRVEVP